MAGLIQGGSGGGQLSAVTIFQAMFFQQIGESAGIRGDDAL
jgi:hypothetical protein